MYDIQEQLRRLAPSGGDDRRSLWLEALRGEPEEWADYQTLLDDGEVSDEDDYLALWQMECPDEIAWYEVSVSCFRVGWSYSDCHQILAHLSNCCRITDGFTENLGMRDQMI